MQPQNAIAVFWSMT